MKIFKIRGNRNINRQEVAIYLATLLTGSRTCQGPWRKSEGDDNDWQLDAGNDWFLHFDPSDPSMFYIKYRYNGVDCDREAVFYRWLEDGIGFGKLILGDGNF